MRNNNMSKNSIGLRHNIGDTLQLQFAHNNDNDRYYVKLFGYLENKSILITSPRFDGVPLKISNDEKFIIRMFSGNDAKVFTASVIHTSLRPYPHLHLTYPDDIQSITVRKAERVNCKLIATIQNKNSAQSADEGLSVSIHDISTSGTQLLSRSVLGEVGDSISINVKITIAEMEQYLTIEGIIRRTINTADKDSFEYGIEFEELKENDKLVLLAFIYEQMIKN